jgi:hypothetical protein
VAVPPPAGYAQAPAYAQPVPYPPSAAYAPPATYAPPAPARAVSPALVGLGAAIGTVALLALLYLYVLPHRGETTAAKTQSAAFEKPEAAGSAPASKHPLAKHLEVAGVRMQESAGGKLKVELLTINHSSADLPGMKMNVKIVAGGREFFTFPVTVPSLGPYESKDLAVSLKTDLKPYELPDWQTIRASFTLASEP